MHSLITISRLQSIDHSPKPHWFTYLHTYVYMSTIIWLYSNTAFKLRQGLVNFHLVNCKEISTNIEEEHSFQYFHTHSYVNIWKNQLLMYSTNEERKSSVMGLSIRSDSLTWQICYVFQHNKSNSCLDLG